MSFVNKNKKKINSDQNKFTAPPSPVPSQKIDPNRKRSIF